MLRDSIAHLNGLAARLVDADERSPGHRQIDRGSCRSGVSDLWEDGKTEPHQKGGRLLAGHGNYDPVWLFQNKKTGSRGK